jgi:hypothetical protein
MIASGASHEIGSVVFFEHVNLRVTEHRAATLFFVEGLGLTRDPYRMVGARNMWVNVGRQQFHLPIGPPTPLPGVVGVVVPDLETLKRSLAGVAAELEGTAFTMAEAGETLRVVSPWGHRLRVHRPEGFEFSLGLAYVEFDVPTGAAAAIGEFYQEVLQCPVVPDREDGEALVDVVVGPGQRFRFRERPRGGVLVNTNHVAVYLTRYRSILEALDKRGLVFEPDAGEQFRFRQIVDLGSGRVLFDFEHEMRSLHHAGYRRPLVNRGAGPREGE